MTLQSAGVFCILGASMLLFATSLVRMDVVALGLMVVLGLSELVTPSEAIAGFGSSSVVAVLGIFILSAGLESTGTGEAIGRLLPSTAGRSQLLLTAAIMLLTALLSSVMSSLAATAVLLPAVAGIAPRMGRPPSHLHIPLAFGGKMGSMLLLIGAPASLIASQQLRQAGFAPLGLLELAPIGLLVLLLGIAFMVTWGRRLLPANTHESQLRKARLPQELAQLYQVKGTLSTLRIRPGCRLAGLTLQESRLGERHHVPVVAIVRGVHTLVAPQAGERILAGDQLVVTSEPEALRPVMEEWQVSLERGPQGEEGLSSSRIGLGEAAVAPRSSFEGKTLREIQFRQRFGLTVLGLWRGGKAILSGLADVPLQVGDAFLLQGPRRQFELLGKQPDLILLDEVERSPRTRRAPLAVAVLAAAMVPVAMGWVSIPLGALAGGLLMVLTGCVRIEEAYRAIEWKVLVGMAGILALGAALEKHGVADLIARHLLGPAGALGAPALIFAVLFLTVGLGVTISSTAAAILMAPVALRAGTEMGVDPRLLMMAVAYGASTSFMTPIGNQSNVLVMGPGGYRHIDFIRVGGPLTVLAALVAGAALSMMVETYP